MDAQLEFGNARVLSYHVLLGVFLIIHAGIKVKPC